MKELRQLILQAYGLRVNKLRILHDRKKSFVVKLQTNHGTYLGKSLNNNATRQHFILEAEKYLRSRGIQIPEVLSTSEGQLLVPWNDRPFVLQTWIDGKPYKLETNRQLQKIAALLGHMHFSSRGFQPVSPAALQYHGARTWETEYQADNSSIRQWQKTNQSTDQPKRKAILSHLPFFLEMGKKAYHLLSQSPYFKQWRDQPLPAHYLCHGDFHMKNIIHYNGILSIIDWEDVRFDFPSKDITRLLNEVLRFDKVWSLKRFDVLLSAYQKENPLSREELGLLYIDLAFPHIFERFLRKQLYRRYPLRVVKQFLHREMKKADDMLQRAKSYV